LAEVGLEVVVFGALFGGPASFTSLPGTLALPGFEVEAGGFFVTALPGRAVPVVLVAADFIGGRAVAALLGLSGFFSWSAFAAVVLAAGFLTPGTVEVVVFVAGALAAKEALVAGGLMSLFAAKVEGAFVDDDVLAGPVGFFVAVGFAAGAALGGDFVVAVAE